MTAIDIDAARKQPLTDEPANNTFVVWYDHYREPYAVYFRSDANAWDDQRWFNADQHHSGGTEPSDWHELCDELFGNDGPHLLVPGHELEQTRAALTASRENAANLANEVGALKAELERMRAVVEAAKAWRQMRRDWRTTPSQVSEALVAAVDALEPAEVAR